MKLLPGPLLLLALAACGSARTHTRDIAATFATEAEALEERAPSKADMNPARAANAPAVMVGTERMAREYVERRGDSAAIHVAYARALLGCALLAQGRTIEARDATRGLKARHEGEVTHENHVIAGAIHAVSVCRSVDARAAGEAFLAGTMPAETFAREYGSFAGLAIAAPGSPDHEKTVAMAARGLETGCAPGVAEPPEAAKEGRAELRRMLAEQAYNDAAALLSRMPPPPAKIPRPADLVWLSKVATKAVTLVRYLMPDMLPMPLSAEQKAWQREQTFPLFRNARDLAGWYLSAEARERIERTRKPETPDEILYDRLLAAQIEALAWIDTR